MRTAAINRRVLALGLTLVALALAFRPGDVRAAASPRTVMPDGTVRYEYGRLPTPVLVCRPHYVCDVTLDSGENVLNMAIGDSAHWVIAGGQSGPGGTTPHVFIKPMQSLLDSNLVITTTKRVYEIALRSSKDARYPRLSFFYADDDAAEKAATAGRQRAAIESVLAGTPQVGADRADAKYKFSGEPALTPDKVFNDGVRTFIQWKTLPVELPTVVAIAKDGTAQAANFRVVGNAYIVDNLASGYDLVLGGNAQRHGRNERRALIRHL